MSGGCFQGGLIKKERPIPNPRGTIPWDGSLWLDIFLIHLPVFSHEFVMVLDQDNMIVFSVYSSQHRRHNGIHELYENALLSL